MFERKKSAGKIYFLPIDQIHPSPFQARRTFEEQELAGLAQSIRENGLLQPISVRKAAEGYELVAGERRLRACKLAQMTTIPAILCSYADEQTAALGLLENIQRTDLNPFEQAQGLRDILVLWDCTQAEAAKRLGMAQPTLANKLRLLQLTGDVVTSCSRTGGEKGWQLYSVSRWSKEDGQKLKRHLEREFEEKKNTQIYWDDVALFCYPQEYQLGIRQMHRGDIVEIDSLEELAELDESYRKYVEGGSENEDK